MKYGPQPTGCSLGFLVVTAFLLTISLNMASEASNAPYGWLRWKRTRYLFTTSVLLKGVKNTPLGWERTRSKLNLTSWAVTGWPFVKRALSTRSATQVLASSW